MSLSQNYPTTRPTLTLDFAKAKRVDPRVTFTRVTAATYFDASGTLRSAAANAPRIDFDPATLACRGMLIEEQRTNSIRNNTMQGAVAGVIGSGGVAPTNWSYGSSASGLTREVVGTGTENGVTYIDLKVSGTSTSSGTVQISPEAATGVAALTGQTWTGAWYVKLVSGSFPGPLNWVWIERDSGGSAVVTAPAIPFGPPDGSALNTQRYTNTRTLSGGASVAYITLRVDITVPNSTVVDFTLRIGLPQLELGAFATSVIPTTTAAATRAADVASVNTLSPWFNASEGTLYAQVTTNTGSSLSYGMATFHDGTTGNRMFIALSDVTAGDPVNTTVISGGATQAAYNAGLYSNGMKAAFGYKLDDFATSGNGSITTDNSGSVPTVDRFYLGSSFVAPSLNGHIRRITYYNTRLPNEQLQALTAP